MEKYREYIIGRFKARYLVFFIIVSILFFVDYFLNLNVIGNINMSKGNLMIDYPLSMIKSTVVFFLIYSAVYRFNNR